MNRNKGFTLIELCLVLFIAGVLLAIGVMSYDLYKARQRYKTSWENMGHIQETLMEYQSVQTYYPCPAAIDAATNAANYGIAYCPTLAAAPPGSCDQGVCRVLSMMDTNGDGVGDTARDANGDGVTDTILIGAVPVTTIMGDVITGTATSVIEKAPLPSNMTVDGWNNRIIYAVSENLVSSLGFRSDYGSIDILDENRTSILGNSPGSAQYLLLSYGENLGGAHSAEGSQVTNCPPGTAETPNCQLAGIFISGILSKGAGAGYYDDMVRFVNWTVSSMWAYSQNSPGSVFNTNTLGNVGVGTNVPATQLDISGGLQATSIYVKEFCDAQGENCYAPEKIGGEDPAMDCGDSNMAVKSIGTNVTGDNVTIAPGQASVGCERVFTSSSDVNADCGPTQFLAGYSTAGPICCNAGDTHCPCDRDKDPGCTY